MLELQNLLRDDASNIPALRLKAELEQAAGNLQAEIRTLKRLNSLQPEDTRTATRLVQLLTLINDLPAAKVLIERLHEQGPEQASTMNLITAWELASGRQDAAKAAAEAAFQAHPQDETAVAFAAIVRLLDQRFEAAQSLLDAQPEGVPLWELLRIRVARAAGQFAAIPPIYERLIEARPSDIRYCQELSAHYIRAEQEAAAQRVLEECATRNPESLEAQLALTGFLARKDRTEAVTLLQQFLTADPDNYRLRFILAELYLAQDNRPAAREQWLTVAEDAGSREQRQARIRLARLALQAGDETEASRLIEAILAAEPNHPDGLALSAVIEIEAGDTAPAIEKLRRVLQEQPDEDAYLTLLGRAYSRSGRRSLAMDSYRSALARNPLNRQAARALSTLLLQEQRFANIETILTPFEAAQRLDNELATALLQVRLLLNDWPAARRLARSPMLTDLNPAFRDLVDGMALLSNGRAEEAIEKLRPLLDNGAASPSIAAALMSAYKQADRWRDGIGMLELTALKGRSPEIETLILKACLDPAVEPQATAYLENRLQTNDGLAVHHRARAALYAQSGDLPAAQAVVTAGLARFPDNVDLELALAGLHERSGDLALAVRSYRNVLQATPDNAVARNNIAVLLAREPQSLPEARELVSSFQFSRNPYFRDTWGWLEHLSGSSDLALSALQYAVDKMPEQAEFRYHLGAASLAVGDQEGATLHLTKAAELLDAGQSFTGSDLVLDLLARAGEAG